MASCEKAGRYTSHTRIVARSVTGGFSEAAFGHHERPQGSVANRNCFKWDVWRICMMMRVVWKKVARA